MNKVKNALNMDNNHATTGTTTTGTTTGTHHNTALHNNTVGHNNGVTGTHGTHATTTGGYSNGGLGTTGAHTGTGNGVTGTSQTSTGAPHNSNILNKLDPRVQGTTTGTNTHAGTHGTHVGTTANAGPGYKGDQHGISSSTNAGPHNSNLANKLDPMVDSDLSSRGNHHGPGKGGIISGSHATPGSGTAQNTAGPHNSDLANRLDPRVDSNLDGSTTIGGNRTYA